MLVVNPAYPHDHMVGIEGLYPVTAVGLKVDHSWSSSR